MICCVGKLGQNGGDGRVKLYTMNGADWSKRYPLIVRDAARIDGSAIIDAEVVWLDSEGMAVFDALHSRANDAKGAFGRLKLLSCQPAFRRPFSFWSHLS